MSHIILKSLRKNAAAKLGIYVEIPQTGRLRIRDNLSDNCEAFSSILFLIRNQRGNQRSGTIVKSLSKLLGYAVEFDLVESNILKQNERKRCTRRPI